MIKRDINVKTLTERIVASLLALLTVAALFVPMLTMWTPSVNALPNNTEYVPDDTYLSGTDFSDHTVGVLAAPTKSHIHYNADGKQIYQAVPKNSTIRIVSESGNKFIRYERSNNTSSNDVYIDIYDTQKDKYTGDFVAEISIRLTDYPEKMGTMNLMQFINRDSGNIFQNLLSMATDGSVRYTAYDPATKQEKSIDTGYDMVEGEWIHLCVVMHRNAVDPDTLDVYVNGSNVAKTVPIKNTINSIHQFRVCQTSGNANVECKIDVDNMWLYKGSAPSFTVGSGANADSVVGKLDYSDPALAVGATVKGKITTDRFEIDARNDLFSVHKDTWRTLLKMDQSKGSPYVDVFAKGASGALVADMAVILGDDWNGRAELLSPYTASGDYVTREGFLYINSSRQLTDGDGNVIAELGSGLNRIALGLSADRSFASVFVNGKLMSTVETKYGSAYKKLDGIRFFQFADTANAGTAYLYFAEIYRGSVPAIALGDSKLEYRHDFDGVTDATQVAPLTFVGSAILRKDLHAGVETFAACALNNNNVTAGSAVRYASPLNTAALSLSFILNASNCDDMDVVRLGETAILSVSGADRRLSVNTAEGKINLFKLEANREYQIALTVANGGISLYIDGIPFVRYAPLPESVPAKADFVDFLYAKKDGSYNTYIDSLEIYTGGTPFVSGAQIPITPTVTTESHKAVLSWKDIAAADGYRVYRAAAKDGDYTDVSGLVTANTYTDATVISGAKYYYRVAAVFVRSGEEFVLGLDATPTEFEDVDPDIDVKASAVPGGVRLTWREFHSANLGYSVYRSYEENDGYELIAEGIKELEYTDTEPFPGLVTYYRVCVIIERDGQPFVFGLLQKPIEATAGEETEAPDIPDDPTDDPTDGPTGDGELPKPMDPVEGGINIPEANTEKVFGSDFEAPLAEINGIKTEGDGFATADVPNAGKVVSFTANTFTAARYLSTELAAPSSLSILIDLKICFNSATNTVYLLAPTGDDGVLFHILEAKTEGDTVTLYTGTGVGGENKTLATFKTAEWHRITVWITSAGDKAAIFLDGSCLVPDAALPINDGSALISAMNRLRIIGTDAEIAVTDGANASPIDATATAVSVLTDDLTVRNADVFANAFNSAILTPKVSVSEKENKLTWKAANGALYYTVWRADESGEFTVIADNVKTTEYVDAYDKDCSYKVTYTYGNVGVTLTALASSAGVSAKKTPVQVVVDTVEKLIDLSNPGTLGILIIAAASIAAVLIVYAVRVFVLKVDPAQPNRIKKD